MQGHAVQRKSGTLKTAASLGLAPPVTMRVPLGLMAMAWIPQCRVAHCSTLHLNMIAQPKPLCGVVSLKPHPIQRIAQNMLRLS